MKTNEVYGVSTDGIETTPNEVYGVSTDGIETTPNEVYGVSETKVNKIRQQILCQTNDRQGGPSPSHAYEHVDITKC